MLNQLPIEKLHKELVEEFSGLEKSLLHLSELFRLLPISDSQKKQFVESSLKQKSAWYACLVNQNIDILLLPEYLESKQSRNILLKKETDQYYKSFENFDFLNNKSNIELFECLLHSENQAPANNGFDLFSSQVVETAKCPAKLEKVMSGWALSNGEYSELSSLVYQFLEWHEVNQFSFASNRQIILWLNYQFRKLYGNISFMFNHELYFYHHWNKESRDMKSSVKELLSFWKKEVETTSESLKALYRDQINYDHLHSGQRIIANHLFETGFKTQYPMPIQMSQFPALKPLLKKGFVSLSDFVGKEDFEKYQELLDQLLEQQFILPVKEDEIYICLNPSFDNNGNRFSQYVNLKKEVVKADWNEFISQSISKPIAPIEVKIEPTAALEPVFIPELKPVKKKAFFG